MSFEEELAIKAIKTQFCNWAYGIKLLFFLCYDKIKQIEATRTDQIVSNAVSPHVDALSSDVCFFM